MSIVDMRDFLAAKYSRKWVEQKTDEQVIRIYHRILVKAEETERERSKKKHA